MRVFRSSSLKSAAKHCPKALTFLEEGAVYDRSRYETGVSAHACLQACGEATNHADRELTAAEVDRVASETCVALIERGRTFDGKPEPPLAADRVWPGRDLAIEWLAFNPLQPGGQYELGLAVDAQWKPCAYDSPLARYRCIIDALRRDTEGDEESAWDVVILRDAKSAWNTDESELDTLQLRSHAVLAWIHFPDVDVIRREVVNLRTRKTFGGTFEFELHLSSDDDLAKLKRWRDDLTATMDAYDRMAELNRGRLPANPGAGCNGCPFLPQCVEALDYIERASSLAPFGSPEERARGYAVTNAVASGLKEWLQGHTDEAPIAIDGALVGTLPKEGRAASALAFEKLYEYFMANGGALAEGHVRGLLKSLKLSLGNIEAAARVMFPGRTRSAAASRDDLIAACVVPDVKKSFGVHRIGVDADAAEGIE